MIAGKTGVALSLALACSACSPSSAPHSSSGEKLEYPIQSATAFDLLGKRMLSNCAAADEKIESTCITAMKKRIASCRTSSPMNFGNEAEYKIAGKKYLACVMPTPICNGIEVTTAEQMRQVCGKS